MSVGAFQRLAVLVGFVLLLTSAREATADLGDDHLQDWYDQIPGAQEALQQGMIGGTVIRACTNGEFLISTEAAVTRWNTALERTTFVEYCLYPDVWVTTDLFSERCTPGAYACTVVTDIDGEAMVNPTYVRLNPDMFPGQGEDADGGARTS